MGGGYNGVVGREALVVLRPVLLEPQEWGGGWVGGGQGGGRGQGEKSTGCLKAGAA